MSMGQSMTPADVAAVVDNRGGYGYGYPVMPMMPFGMGGYGNSFGGDFIWVILLLALFGGWGGGFGGGFAGGGLADGGLLGYAIGNNATKGDLSSGLTNVQNSSKLDSISTQIGAGFANNATQLCNGSRMYNLQSLVELIQSIQDCYQALQILTSLTVRTPIVLYQL